jgi:hypothetical protein
MQAELRDIERVVATGTREAARASRLNCAGRSRAPGSASGSPTAGATSTITTGGLEPPSLSSTTIAFGVRFWEQR